MNRVIKSNWMGIVIVSSTGDGFSQEVMQILATESDALEEVSPDKVRIRIDIGYTDRVFAAYLVTKHGDKICELIDNAGCASQIRNVTECLESVD